MDQTPPSAREGKRATTVATLRRFAGERRVGAPVREYCELCRAPLAPERHHLLEMATHQISCACDPCAQRFETILDGPYKLIPHETHALTDFHLDDAQWNGLALPVDLAFIVHSTAAGHVTAYYPSPAGATEAHFTLSAWDALVADNPALAHMQPDVEALLINRIGPRRLYYLAPIDVCFELVNLMRRHWRGISGGEEIWRGIDAFFFRLEARAVPLGGSPRTPCAGLGDARIHEEASRELGGTGSCPSADEVPGIPLASSAELARNAEVHHA